MPVRAGGGELPEPLASWVAKTLPLHRPASAQLLTRAGVLRAWLVSGADDALLLLDERSDDGGVRALTPREREVLETIGTGATNSEAAARLGIGERTVEKHLEHVYEKLGVPNRLAAVNAFTATVRRTTY